MKKKAITLLISGTMVIQTITPSVIVFANNEIESTSSSDSKKKTDDTHNKNEKNSDYNSKVNKQEAKTMNIGTYGDFSNMSNIGLNRGNYHGRQVLGFILPKNTKLKVRQINNKFQKDLTLNLFNDDSKTEKKITIPKNGGWVSIENQVESVPFIKKVSSEIIPKVEFMVEGDVKPLPIYRRGDNENQFFNEWDSSDVSFSFIENGKVQMLVPKKDKNTLRKMKDFNSINELFKFYTEMINKYDYLLGLDKDATNPLDKNVDTQYFVKANKNGAGAAYYSTDYTAQNSDSLSAYLEKGWLPLHEVGHGYEYNIKNKGINLVDVFNNILAHFYQRTFEDGDKGWLFGKYGDRAPIDTKMKKIRETGSYDTAGYNGQLAVFVYLIEFMGQDKFAEFNKLYRSKNSKGELNNKNIGAILRELISDVSGYDLGPYFDLYKIPNNENKILGSEKYLNEKNVFILGDIVKNKDKAEKIRVEKNLKSKYSLISTEEIMSSKVSLEKGILNVNFDDIDSVNGETIYLIDGNKVIDKLTIDKNKKNTFKNIVPGRYKITMGSKNIDFNKYIDIKTVDVYSGNNTVNLKKTYSKEAVSLFDQSILLKGLGDNLFAEITTDLENDKLKIRIKGGKPHVYFNNTYAKLEILDENNTIIYSKDFIGDQNQAAETKILDIKPGYKIKVFHAEPSRRQVADLGLQTQSPYSTTGSKNVEFIVSDTGLNINGIKDTNKLYEIVHHYAERLKHDLGDNITNYNFYRNHRTMLNRSINFLPMNLKQEIIKNYGDIIHFNPLFNIKSSSKLTYFKPYGVIFEGEVSNVKFDSTVKKILVVKDINSKVLKEVDIISTDWYDKGNYSGFQAILSLGDLRSLGNVKNAKVYIKTKYKGDTQEVVYKDLNGSVTEVLGQIIVPNTPNWESKYYDNIRVIPEIKFNKESIKIDVNSENDIHITTGIQSSLNEISKYTTSNNSFVFDGVIDGSFDLKESKKTFEVKDKNGQVVYIGNIATFSDTSYPQYNSGSVIQVIVPSKYSNSSYTVDIVVKNEANEEIGRFTIKPYL